MAMQNSGQRRSIMSIAATPVIIVSYRAASLSSPVLSNICLVLREVVMHVLARIQQPFHPIRVDRVRAAGCCVGEWHAVRAAARCQARAAGGTS